MGRHNAGKAQLLAICISAGVTGGCGELARQQLRCYSAAVVRCCRRT